MRLVGFALPVLLCVTGYAAETNPCTNGSFEELAPSGFPVDWGPVGVAVEVVGDAHSGRHALRLVRTADTTTRETGLNRGHAHALIDRLSGGIDFWYKALSARAADLNVYAIPMNKNRVEGTSSLRATFTVPGHHVGDGRWHHGRLKYDFTDNPDVKWVHFAARIVGTAGDLLLDDFSHVERVGAIVRAGALGLEEDPAAPGRRCTIRARIENAGDLPAQDVRASLKTPPGLKTTAAELRLGDLAPEAGKWAKWTVEGERVEPATFAIAAVSGEAQTTASLEIAPALVLRSFGPVAPVALVGEPITLECVLKNTAAAIVRNPTAVFELPSGNVTERADEIAPGQTVTLSTRFTAAEQTPALAVSVRAGAENVDEEPAAGASVVVGSAAALPAPSGRLRAVAEAEYALLENGHVRLALRRNRFGFGPGELSVATAAGWQPAVWLARLSRLVLQTADGTRHEEVVFAADPPEIGAADPARLAFRWSARDADGGVGRPAPSAAPSAAAPARLAFRWSARDADGATWQLAAAFELSEGAKRISTRYELTCDRAAQLLAFEGPFVHVLDRDEAVFPGLEWLVDDEVSSSSLDIEEDHAHRLRYVVHPNMVTIPAIGIQSARGTVGLVWDVHQKWDGRRDRPAVVFASPNRFENQRSHAAGLFLPSVPEFVEPNTREAARPYPMEPGRPLVIESMIVADGTSTDVLAALDIWFSEHGLPEPVPLPRGSYDREIAFSMQAYLDSLWVPEEKLWWTSKGSKILSGQGRPPLFVADLLLGKILSPDDETRRRCRARADEVLALTGGEPRVDAQRFPRGFQASLANPARAAGLLAGRDEAGAWRFDADQEGRGPFVGRDYHGLGRDEAVELGTCARKAFEVLRYARIAGDWEAYEQVQPTLALLETFRVPRAAQVWEVPVHTPDVLAAADAVDAFLEAYRFSGEDRWLRDAVTWARRGLPFIYLWDDPEKPFLAGASIPVFGATWHRGSWFGRPVQWNGLRYANALLGLAEFDQGYPWPRIAEMIIRSAIHQQASEGEDVALWPDNVSAIDSARCPWVFAPRQIIRNVLKLTGRDEDPATVILGHGRQRLHVTATARIADAAWDASVLSFSATYPKGEQGTVLVANVARPTAVELSGEPLAERSRLETGDLPGWHYDAANAYLAIRVGREGPSAVCIQGATFRQVQRLPWLVESIAFEFDESTEGWLAAHHVAELESQSGSLVGAITGNDPYLVRSVMDVDATACPVLRLRMRTTGGTSAQLFWTTEASPTFGEDKSLGFAIEGDGQFHEYRLEPGRHPKWASQAITAIRIDPTVGIRSGGFAIDYLRGTQE